MALSTTFLGGILCTLHNPRVTTAMQHNALLTTPISHTKRSTIIVRATQDGYAITGSSKSVKSNSLSNIHTDNAGKASAVEDAKSFKFIESFRLPEFLLPITSGEAHKGFVKQAEQSIERGHNVDAVFNGSPPAYYTTTSNVGVNIGDFTTTPASGGGLQSFMEMMQAAKTPPDVYRAMEHGVSFVIHSSMPLMGDMTSPQPNPGTEANEETDF